MKTRYIPKMILPFAVLIAIRCSAVGQQPAGAQQQKEPVKAFYGPYDTEFSYPASEGTTGRKDSVALEEIKASAASSLVPEHAGLEVTGTLTSGSGNDQQQNAVSFAIDNGRRFRLDIQRAEGTRTSRVRGDSGKTMQSGKTPEELEDIEFVNPLALPSLLGEIADRKDAAVIDDGTVAISGHSMNKVTITLFQSWFGSPVSASFYFDSNTHLLEKGVFVEHSAGNRALKFLVVMTYGDYRTDQSLLLPHEYTRTVNGQMTMNLKVTNISITSGHDDSYFSF
jgi:hypothetical protein